MLIEIPEFWIFKNVIKRRKLILNINQIQSIREYNDLHNLNLKGSIILVQGALREIMCEWTVNNFLTNIKLQKTKIGELL